MKSALELAMEKTATKAGIKLTEKQRKEIEEIRSVAKSKVAEEEIMVAQKLGAMPDPQAASILKEHSAAFIRKILDKADAEIEQIRGGNS